MADQKLPWKRKQNVRASLMYEKLYGTPPKTAEEMNYTFMVNMLYCQVLAGEYPSEVDREEYDSFILEKPIEELFHIFGENPL